MKIKNSKIARRLILCLVTLLIPVILINVASNIYNMMILHEQVLTSSKILFDTLSKDIDGVLSEIQKNAYSLSSDVEMLALNSKDKMTPSRILEHRRQILNLGYVARSSSISMDINLYYLESKKVISSSGTMTDINIKLNLDELNDAGLDGMWLITEVKNKEDRLCYRYLVTGVDGKEGVVISMDIPLTAIKNLLRSIKMNNNSNTFIILKNGENIYSDSQAIRISKELENLEISNQTAMGQIKANGNKEAYLYRLIGGQSIVLCSFFSQEEFMGSNRFTMSVSVVVIILSAVLGFVLVLMAYKIIVKPIHTLVSAMRDVGDNKLSVEIPYEGNDEIGFMYAQFNGMVAKLQNLINQVYLQKIYNQEIKISMYQTQINPHFLHNCLNFINQSALAHSDNYTAKMSQFLSKYFRYNISSEDMTTTLNDEIGIVTTYIEIQKMRFPGKIGYTISIQKGIEDIRIPKLIVQPLVENCFVHVLGKISHTMVIGIEAHMYNNELTILVKDNSGILTNESLKQMNENIKSGYVDLAGIGLSNIQSRICSYFGGCSGLKLSKYKGSLRAEILIELGGKEN